MYSVVVLAVICVVVVGGNILDRLKGRAMGDEINIGYVVENKDVTKVSTVGKSRVDEYFDQYDEEDEKQMSRSNAELEEKKNKNVIENVESLRTQEIGETRNSKNMQFFSIERVGDIGSKMTNGQRLVTLSMGEKVKNSKRHVGQRLVEFKTHDEHETKHKSSHNHRLVEYRLEEPHSLENHKRTLKNVSYPSKKETLSNIQIHSSSLPLNESGGRKSENFKPILKSGEKPVLNFKAEVSPPDHRLNSVIRNGSGWKESYNKDKLGDGHKISLELSDQPRLECTIAPEEDNSVIRAALLLPNNTDYISALPKVLPVLMLAQAEVHRRQLLPKNLSFLFLPRDDRCDAVYAQLGTFEAARQNVHVFFGPACEYSVGKLEFDDHK